MRGTLIAVAIVIASLVTVGPAAGAEDPPDIGVHQGTGTDSFDIHASLDGKPNGTVVASSNSGSNVEPPTEYVRAPLCWSTTTRSDQSPYCPNDDPIVQYCLDGSEAVLPTWRRTQDPDGNWGPWSIYRDYYCPNDAPLISAIEHEWTQLKPQPSAITLQPNTGWVIATVPTIAMAGDAPRLHSAVLLGANVDIRATASGYRWTWGDGSHTTTTDPGRPYPNATVTHTYPHASDAATVQLTTTWSGEFRINGGPWQPFTSTITSDSDPVPLTVYDPRSRLVDCTLEGVCHLASNG